ncbi:MAG: hypothetical protein NVS3B10_01840 [Polyangiales bacterium]
MGFGYLELAALSMLAFVAALAIALRAAPDGRAELALTTMMVTNFLVIVPIYALGLTHHLTARTLGLGALLFFTGALAAASIGRDRRSFFRDIIAATLALSRLPLDGLRLAARQRSVVTLGLALSAIAIAWSAYVSWLAPSWGQWDALWYHEPIIGFTIQNHGFAFVDLPVDAQKINGYPRLCEMTQLWFVVFTDRRLIEVANSLAAPGLVLAVYLLARRFTRDRVVAMGWGACLLLMPASSILLQTIYVDVQNAIFVLAAVYFATKPKLRLRDAAVCIVCLTLAIGSKAMAMVPVGIVAPFAAVHVLQRHGKTRLGASLAVIALGVALIAGMAATTYLRNYFRYHNPLWPDLKYDNAKWNIHWPGSIAWGTGTEDVRQRVNMNLPLPVFLEDLYRIPWTVDRSFYGQTYEYGFVVGWLLVPATLVALAVAAVSTLRALVARLAGLPPPPAHPGASQVLLLAVPMLAMLYMSPALWSARYNIAAVGLAMVLVAWLGARSRSARLAEGTVAAATVGMIVMFFWVQPRWWYWPQEAATLARLPYPEREVTPAAKISPTMYHARGSAILRDVGLAREREIGAGDVVAFSDNYGGFLALFWNNRFSNRAVWVPHDDFVAGIERVGAKWVYCNYSDGNLAALRAAGSGWQEIGTLNDEGWGAMFRRVAP